MSILKVTIFQKNINVDITRDQKQKIISQKSDFLIFPEFYPFYGKLPEKHPSEYERIYTDKLLEVSEYYKGVIIGGSYIRQFENAYYISCPIIQDLRLIDWYDKRSIEKIKNLKLGTGSMEGIFVLGGIRFGILLGNEINHSEYLDHLKKEKISYLFNPSSVLSDSESEELQYKEDMNLYGNLASQYDLNIVRICGLGKNLNNEPLSGRSLYSCSTGIKWKVAFHENQAEVIKTVAIQSVQM